MDNQSYKRLQKMLMHGTSSIEEDDREEDIESEPPRYYVRDCIVANLMTNLMYLNPVH